MKKILVIAILLGLNSTVHAKNLTSFSWFENPNDSTLVLLIQYSKSENIYLKQAGIQGLVTVIYGQAVLYNKNNWELDPTKSRQTPIILAIKWLSVIKDINGLIHKEVLLMIDSSNKYLVFAGTTILINRNPAIFDKKITTVSF